VAVVLFFAAAVAPLNAEDRPATWPQWRGPTRDGQVAGAAWPTTLQGEALKQLWRVELDPGYSGPVVAADRVFVTETKDKTVEVVRALDRSTGKEVWQAQWKAGYTPPAYARAHGEWIRSTPALDGDSLYVAGMRDVLICLDTQTGKERWRVDFAEHFKTTRAVFGLVCSPLVDAEAVYVQAAGAAIKLDKKTGKVLWHSFPDEGGPNGSAVSSPVLATLAGKPQLLVQNRRKLAGLDPASGEVLWSEDVPAFNSINILTPFVYKDSVFTSAYGGRSHLFSLAQKDSKLKVTTAWTHNAQAYLSTPVAVDGHLYLHLRNQRLTCLDLEKGEERWTSSQSFGQYWSMVARGDSILALDQRGTLYLVKANPKKFELLDSRKVSDEDTWAHLAVCGDQLFVREMHAIAAYRWQPPAPSKPK